MGGSPRSWNHPALSFCKKDSNRPKKKQTINSEGYKAKWNSASQMCKIFQECIYNLLLKNEIEHLALHCGWKGRGRCIFCDTRGYEGRIKCQSRDEVKPSRDFFSNIWKQHTWRAITPDREPGFLVVMLLLVPNKTQPIDMKDSPSNVCREDTSHWRASIAAASLITVWYTKEKKWKTYRERTENVWSFALLVWERLLGFGKDS